MLQSVTTTLYDHLRKVEKYNNPENNTEELQQLLRTTHGVVLRSSKHAKSRLPKHSHGIVPVKKTPPNKIQQINEQILALIHNGVATPHDLESMEKEVVKFCLYNYTILEKTSVTREDTQTQSNNDDEIINAILNPFPVHTFTQSNNLGSLDQVEQQIQHDVAKWNEMINKRKGSSKMTRAAPKSLSLVPVGNELRIEDDFRLSKSMVSLIGNKVAFTTSRNKLENFGKECQE
jgi:hypothetical protein